MLLWTVIGLYAAGRFAMFFVRSGSDDLALGLSGAQWTSLSLLLVAAVATCITAKPTTASGDVETAEQLARRQASS